jgi:hypothetical protein
MTSPTAGPRRTPSLPPAPEQSDSPEIGPAPQVGLRRSRAQADLPIGSAPPAQRARLGSPDAPVQRSLSPLPSLTFTLAEQFAVQNPQTHAARAPAVRGPVTDVPTNAAKLNAMLTAAPAALAQDLVVSAQGSQPLPFFATENPGIVWQAQVPQEVASHRFGDSHHAPVPPAMLTPSGSPQIGPAPRAGLASPHALAPHSGPPSPDHGATVQAELLDQLDAALGLQPAAPTEPDPQAALSREAMGLPPRPTTPPLMAKMNENLQNPQFKAALNRTSVALEQALKDPGQQQILQDLGIDPYSYDVGQGGRVQRRLSTATPIFERAEREARKCLEGLTEADMSLEDQAILMTAIIRAHLSRLTVFDAHGRVAEWLAPDPNLPRWRAPWGSAQQSIPDIGQPKRVAD